MIALAVGIEVAYAYAIKMNGYSVDLLAKYGSPQFISVSPVQSSPVSQYPTHPSLVFPPRPRRLASRSLYHHSHP
jgi:hypothetical protein